MKIVRSIAGIFCGIALAVFVMTVAETINGIVNQPDDGKTFAEFQETLKKDMKAMKAWVESLPAWVMVVVLLGWELGAFLGGGLAALIAGYRPRLHAACVGVFVLVGTIMNFYMMKALCEISHPDYIIVLGLLLPLPSSILAGTLVDKWFPSQVATISNEGSLRPTTPNGAIKEGEPPIRPA
jgi:hypothetical protein